MRSALIIVILCSFNVCRTYAQKVWEDDGVTITKLDTLADGYEALRGSFVIENTSIYEVMNLILDVDGYEWVEGESRSEMLLVDAADSSFTFDFFVDIPWLFVKKTGRVRVDINYKDGAFFTKSTQIKEYDRNEDYDLVDFYSAQWKLEQLDQRHVKVTYLGIYQDVKMVVNINGIIINRIRKRLNSTFHNLIDLASNKSQPINILIWP
ncbi:MAG: hypothetical protein HWE39_14920 [Oceanospirillaceae bacterium]|nr:hypothetical protein [Oceanospirillaceae bacterium]